jgi:hypothetical protein
MRDRELAEKRAREAAQGQRSAEGDSADSPLGKQPARSGVRGKRTPEHGGGRGRSPSGATNRMQTIDDGEAAEAQRRSAQNQRGKGGKGKGLGRGGPRTSKEVEVQQVDSSNPSDNDIPMRRDDVERTNELQELSKVCAVAHRASLLPSHDLTLLGEIRSERANLGTHIPGGYSPNRPKTPDHESELASNSKEKEHAMHAAIHALKNDRPARGGVSASHAGAGSSDWCGHARLHI